ALKRSDPVCRPSSNYGVGYSPGVTEEALILAEWKLISATEVHDLADIEVSQTPVEHWAKTRYRGCAQSTCTSSVQQVTRIRERLRVGIGEKEAETIRVLLFESQQQAVIVAHSIVCLVASTPEVGEGYCSASTRVGSIFRVCTMRQKRSDVVCSDPSLKILRLGKDICRG